MPAFWAALRPRLAAFAVTDLRDETGPELSPGELAALEREHPLLAQVLEDLASLEESAVGSAPRPSQPGGPPFSRADLEALEKRIGAEAGEISPALLAVARRLLWQEWREVHSTC